MSLLELLFGLGLGAGGVLTGMLCAALARSVFRRVFSPRRSEAALPPSQSELELDLEGYDPREIERWEKEFTEQTGLYIVHKADGTCEAITREEHYKLQAQVVYPGQIMLVTGSNKLYIDGTLTGAVDEMVRRRTAQQQQQLGAQAQNWSAMQGNWEQQKNMFNQLGLGGLLGANQKRDTDPS